PVAVPQPHNRRQMDVSRAVGDYTEHLSHNEIRRGTRWCDWGSLGAPIEPSFARRRWLCDWCHSTGTRTGRARRKCSSGPGAPTDVLHGPGAPTEDRKSTRLNSSHVKNS